MSGWRNKGARAASPPWPRQSAASEVVVASRSRGGAGAVLEEPESTTTTVIKKWTEMTDAPMRATKVQLLNEAQSDHEGDRGEISGMERVA